MSKLYTGGFVYDGVTYDWQHDKESLMFMKDSLTLREDDVVIATYPKSGMWYNKHNDVLSS